MTKWKLFLVLGSAWARKWTLRKNLEKANIEDLQFIKSYVTRDMREWEINWDVYNFISEEKFKEMIKNDEFLEYEFVHKKAYYGTRLEDVVELWIEKWKKVMKEIDMEWLKNILKNNSHLKENIVTIFLNLSQEKFAQRIEARWAFMSEEDYKNREESSVREVREAKIYCDHIIDTSEKTPEEVFEEVLEILN